MSDDALFAMCIPLVIVGIWFGMLALLAGTGGWTALAEKYGIPDRMPEGVKMGRQTASLGKSVPVNYSGVLTFTVTPEGLGIAIATIFRFRHAPMFIPWADLAVTEGRTWRGKSATLKFLYVEQEMTLYSPAGAKAVLDAHNTFHGRRV